VFIGQILEEPSRVRVKQKAQMAFACFFLVVGFFKRFFGAVVPVKHQQDMSMDQKAQQREALLLGSGTVHKAFEPFF
jgi:hypothetical protein